MAQSPDFEYQYRWAEGLNVEALEARDQALEDHLQDNFGAACSVDFEYQYRWSQILGSPLDEQITMLEADMQALEQAVTDSGGCRLEFPYRWSQFWEGLLAGEPWAIACAEENDRAMEARFGQCTCGCPGGIQLLTSGTLGWNGTTIINSNAGTIDANDTILSFGPSVFSGTELLLYYDDFIGDIDPAPAVAQMQLITQDSSTFVETVKAETAAISPTAGAYSAAWTILDSAMVAGDLIYFRWKFTPSDILGFPVFAFSNLGSNPVYVETNGNAHVCIDWPFPS